MPTASSASLSVSALTRSALVDAKVVTCAELVGLRLVGAHRVADDVAVASRTDAAADQHVDVLPRVDPNPLEQGDSSPVHVIECLRRVTEPGPPVEICAPGRRVEHDADAVSLGDRHVGRVVGPQRFEPVRVIEEDEGSEVRQLEPLAEDQGRLHPAVGDEGASVELCEGSPGRQGPGSYGVG
jgi:hypothetical protein